MSPLTGKAAVVLVWDGSDPPPPEELLSQPGSVAVLMPVPDGWSLAALVCDPKIQQAADLGLPVVLDFESIADAEAFGDMVDKLVKRARH